MNTAFYSALSGLSSYAGALNVVGNNLANINTSGFKTSEVSFEDLVTRTFNGVATNGAGNPLQIGLGALTNSISGIFSQGSIKSTSDATNVAIEGNGFFVVGDGATEQFYTRAGNFFLNDDGILVNPAGKSVLGYTTMDANNEIQASGALTEINLAANQTAGPEESTWIDIFANLDVRAADDSTFAASTTFYDSKGAPHVMTATFTHNGPAVQDPGNGNDWWSVVVEIPGEDVGQLAGTTYDMLGALTEIEFDGTGTLIAPADVANAGELDLTVVGFANGADDIAAGELTWRLYDPDDGTPQLTGYPLPSSVTSTNTDGYPPGNLTSIVVDQDGIIQGVFSNGQVIPQAQLAIAQFNSSKGLLRMGRNLYAATEASGVAAIGAADTGGRGNVVGSSLEASNVDIAQEFTQMLVYERGYQANSKIISAADTLIQTAISLVR